MKHAIIIGATSGIGQEVAKKLLADGWQLGIAGRREQELQAFRQMFPHQQIAIQVLDVTREDAHQRLDELIEQNGGMDLFFLASGIGRQNVDLEPDLELRTAETNVTGFIRMVTAAFRYFKTRNGGHIAVISSIAGTKGLGVAPAYSATKRFQNTYIDALAQLAHIEKINIRFTDIRPGFVKTALLSDNNKYPMLMKPERVAALIVKALYRKKRVAVIDRRYACLVFFWKLIPRLLWERLSIKTGKKG
ncbi:MAG: SDR family NAD(P)-dependent oxidoreductase [Bacteroidales bacterium]|jgi:NADP-dependent 3-hydroxy acid dehydrogenase YdfG|nr:SDR family NAD(P)-dependent oxidoreductase [Bacteroidales bacterium]